MHSILSYQILNATIIGQKSLSYFRHMYLSNKLSQSVATVYWKGTYVFVNDIGAHPLRGDLRLPLRGLLSPAGLGDGRPTSDARRMVPLPRCRGSLWRWVRGWDPWPQAGSTAGCPITRSRSGYALAPSCLEPS